MSPVRSSAYKKRHGAIKSQIHPEPQAPLQIPPHSDDIPGKNNSPPGEYQQPPLTGEPARIGGLKAKKTTAVIRNPLQRYEELAKKRQNLDK